MYLIRLLHATADTGERVSSLHEPGCQKASDVTCPTNDDYAHVVIDPAAERPGLGIHKLSHRTKASSPDRTCRDTSSRWWTSHPHSTLGCELDRKTNGSTWIGCGYNSSPPAEQNGTPDEV